MIYRVITVWRDDENDPPIVRAACDFDTHDAAEQHILTAVKLGVVRTETTHAQLPGGCLMTVYTPIGKIIGWYVYELPDTVPTVNGKLH